MAKKKKKDMHYTDEGAMVPFGEGAKQYKAEGGVAKVLPKEDPAKRAEMKRRYYQKRNPQYVAKGERRFFIDDPDRGTGEYRTTEGGERLQKGARLRFEEGGKYEGGKGLTKPETHTKEGHIYKRIDSPKVAKNKYKVGE